jgi:hypothetical protein
MKNLFQTKLAAVLAAALLVTASLSAEGPVSAGGQQLEGAWVIDLLGDPPAASARTSGLFGRDGTIFIQNTVPDFPGVRTIQGVGEWVRTGDREFALTWVYIVVSTVDGSYFGTFKDRAKVSYSADGSQLTGQFTFEVTLADGSKPFSGTGKVQATRVRVEPLIQDR